MAGITQAQAEAQLTAYLAAETAVLNGQAYSIAGRTMTKANLAEIRDGIKYWDSMVNKKARTGLKTRFLTPT